MMTFLLSSFCPLMFSFSCVCLSFPTNATGLVSTFAGGPLLGNADGFGTSASFRKLRLLTVDSSGTLYVVDRYTIRQITSAGLVSTIAGTYGRDSFSDGIGSSVSFNSPYGITVDSWGTIIVSDRVNCRLRVVSSSGVCQSSCFSFCGIQLI